MSGALSRVYETNPDINQQRAAVRAADENVPAAKSGFLPKASASVSVGHQVSQVSNLFGVGAAGSAKYVANPRTESVTLSETLFDGFKTPNEISKAESGVLVAREQLRETELTTLLNAATAYMDVLRDSAVLNLTINNVKVLELQLKQTRDRFEVGEVTRTDVAQAESALESGKADVAVARSTLETSVAKYRQQIGENPRHLRPAQPIERLLPRTLGLAIETGLSDHPTIIGALHEVDVAQSAVSVAESALLPTASVSGQFENMNDVNGFPNYKSWSAAVVGQINIPIYQGGQEYAAVRQAKEQLGQARLAVDSARLKVRQGVSESWGQLRAARASIVAYRAAVKAAKVALEGVREEAKVGQRTTLDVLNAQQALLKARVQLVQAQRDRVVYSYSVMAAIGELSAHGLGLDVAAYNPSVHYNQEKNRFFGLDTPDGR